MIHANSTTYNASRETAHRNRTDTGWSQLFSDVVVPCLCLWYFWKARFYQEFLGRRIKQWSLLLHEQSTYQGVDKEWQRKSEGYNGNFGNELWKASGRHLNKKTKPTRMPARNGKLSSRQKSSLLLGSLWNLEHLLAMTTRSGRCYAKLEIYTSPQASRRPNTA